MYKLEGMNIPGNGRRPFQKNWVALFEAIEQEIINRDLDTNQTGIVKGGLVKFSGGLQVSISECLGYDGQGRRISTGDMAVTLNPNEIATIGLRHKFIINKDPDSTHTDGFQIEHRQNSFEVVHSSATDDLALAEVVTDGTGVVSITDKRTFRQNSTRSMFVGFVFDYTGSSLPKGFVWASGKTIGDVGSGATERENADCFDLFCLYWNEDNANFPLLDKDGFGKMRGASALADWMAKCKIYIPDLRDRVSVGKGDMGGSAAGRLTVVDSTKVGNSGGEEKHVLSEAEMPIHKHDVSLVAANIEHTHGINEDGPKHPVQELGNVANTYQNANDWMALTWQLGSPLHNHGGATRGMNSNITHNHTVNESSKGSGHGHNNVQPVYVCSKVVKL